MSQKGHDEPFLKGTVVDVGGGTGELLPAILAANPSLREVLFDLPHVTTQATRVLADRGVRDRVQVVGDSFFENVPTAAIQPCPPEIRLRAILFNGTDERQEVQLGQSANQPIPEGTTTPPSIVATVARIPPYSKSNS